MSKEEIMIIDLIKKNAKLIEEIEILKQEIENQKNIKAFWHIKNDIKKERIDKAIEFIKEHNIVGMNKEYLPRGYECCYSGELMEILKGGNDE